MQVGVEAILAKFKDELDFRAVMKYLPTHVKKATVSVLSLITSTNFLTAD